MNIENLHAGDYIAVTEVPELYTTDMMGQATTIKQTALIGIPLRVLAVSAPFIAVEYVVNGQRNRMSLDWRQYGITKVNQEYFNSLTEQLLQQQPQNQVCVSNF